MPVNILIAEDIPSHNKGEAALFFGMVESFAHIGPHSVNLFSTTPDIDARNYAGHAQVVDARGCLPAHIVAGQGSTTRKAFNYAGFLMQHFAFMCVCLLSRSLARSLYRRAFWRSYLDCDIAVLGHDSFWAPLYHAPLLTMFRVLGVPTAVYAGTLIPANVESGGVKKRISNWLTKFGLKRARLITLRERFSKEGLLGLGLDGENPPIEVHPDLAFVMPACSEKRTTQIVEQEQIPTDRPICGMAYSRRMLRRAFPGAGDDAVRLDGGATMIARLIDHLVEDKGMRVVFVPHSIGPEANLDDRRIADAIIEKVASKNRQHVTNIRTEYASQELKGLASRLAITVGSRLHFTIDALCGQVPSILLSHAHDIRCHGIVGDMLGLEDYVLNVDELNADSLIAKADDLMDRHEAISAELGRILPGIKERTYRHGDLAGELITAKAAPAVASASS